MWHLLIFCLPFLLMAGCYEGKVKPKVAHVQITGHHEQIPSINGGPYRKNFTDSTNDLILDQLSLDTSILNHCHHVDLSKSQSDTLILSQKVILTNLLQSLEEMSLQLESHIQSRLTHLLNFEDIFNSKKILDQDWLAFKSFEENLFSTKNTFGTLIKKFILGHQSMGCQLSPALIRRAMGHLECLQQIQRITPPPDTLDNFDGSKIQSFLTPISNLIQNEQLWLDFLVELFGDLSHVEVQVYNKLNLKKDYWTTFISGHQNESRMMIYFEKSNFDNFWLKFNQLPSLWHRDQEKMWKILLDFNGQFKIDCLNQLLTLTLTPKLDISSHPSDPSHVIVEGNFVILSKILDELTTSAAGGGGGRNFSIKILTILASHTIFLDVNLIASKLNFFSMDQVTSPSLAIIAPNWWMDDTLTIKLDGIKGPRVSSISGVKMADSAHRGQPGLPGGPGGHFFGIGEHFHGPNKILISVNGGRGGPGQAGGDGSNGRNGSHLSLDSVKCDGKRPAAGGNNEKNFLRIDFTPYGHNESENFKCKKNQCGPYNFWGEVGEPGGKGWDGGLGGYGGWKGSIIFVPLRNEKFEKNIISIRQPSNGRTGLSGAGGMGGRGGISGRSIVTDVKSKYNFWQFEYTCYFVHQQILAGIPAPNGANGMVGGNGRHRKEAVVKKKNFDFGIHSGQLNLFKRRAWGQIQGRDGNKFLTHFLQNFLLQMEENEAIQKVYDARNLVAEFSILESFSLISPSSSKSPSGVQLVQKNDELNFIPFYTSLLHRTHRVASKLRGENDEGNGDKKIILKSLTFLYTTILSKICALKAPSDPLLVINIESSLTKILETVDTLKGSIRHEEKYSMVKAHKENYESQIQDKITQVHNLIGTIIEPEIVRIEHRIESNIDKLIDEIIILKKNTVNDLQTMAKSQQALQRQVKFSAIFGGLRTLTQFLYFLGPQGAIGATFIGKGLGCVESFLPSSSSSANHNGGDGQLITKIPTAIKNMNEAVTTAFKSWAETRLTGFEEELKEVKKILAVTEENYAENLTDIVLHIDGMQREVKAKMEKLVDSSKNDRLTDLGRGVEVLEKLRESENFVQDGQKNLQTALKSKKEILENQVSKVSQAKSSILSTLSKVGLAIRVVEVGALSYQKFKGDKDKVAILAGEVTKVEGQLKKIQQQIQSVHTILSPMIQSMRENMEDFRLNLGNQSGAALQISKWQVTQGLKELKEFIQKKFTEGFQIDQEMGRCLDLMTEAMTTLINIFDRLQRYQEEAQLVTFMAAIMRVDDDDDQSNWEVKKEIQNLEIILQSNLILSRYEEAMRSFKMWVFPFAGYYSDDQIELVQNFSSMGTSKWKENSVRDLATVVGSNVQKLMVKLNYYKDRVGPYDQFLHHKAFYPSVDPMMMGNSRNGSLVGQGGGSGSSFYVWGSEEFGPLISRLLSGEKIILKAPIEKSPSNMNAIKFRRIDLTFRIRSDNFMDGGEEEARQQELWGQLRHFKVNLTHMGNSYYRFRNQVHLISSPRVSISFSFELYNGLPAERNQVYEKLRHGDLVLSPYALWEIELLPMLGMVVGGNGGGGGVFQQLAKLADKYPIDLELNGEGNFVDEELYIIDPMDKGKPYYYERDVVVTSKVERNIEETDWDFVSHFWAGWGP